LRRSSLALRDAGDSMSRFTIVGAAKKSDRSHASIRPTISAGSNPPDAGTTLTAARATCGTA